MTKDYSKYFTPSLNQARKRRGEKVEIIRFKLGEKYRGVGTGKKYHLKTYGCQGNLADSERIAGILEAMGFSETLNEMEADLILFNTCAIRENAENRVFGELGRIQKIKKEKPDLVIGVCGCMPQEEMTVNSLKKRFPNIDLIFGTHNIIDLPAYIYDIFVEHRAVIDVWSIEGNIAEEIPVKRDHAKKAWVNIMYGCDEFCTYCIVPYTRGKERSRLPEEIIKEVQALADEGYLEVTLLGQNVNAYGKDLEGRNYGFADLLKDLHKLPIPRIRFTTSHPRDFDDATIEAMALGGNIMPHLHLPVQSGNDRVLKKMNRKYTREEYITKMKKLKEAVPGISITTDFIVAFPSETEEEFNNTISLVHEIQFDGAFTFIFSPRAGTPAASYPNTLTPAEKKDRLQRLNQVVNHYSLLGNKRFEGQIVEVLVEGFSKTKPDVLTGYTPHNKLVNFVGDESLIGTIVKVKIEKAFSWHLRGVLV
jgi:tRNA-2-methylthio-N6-dimethylallyladenosine synthase